MVTHFIVGFLGDEWQSIPMLLVTKIPPAVLQYIFVLLAALLTARCCNVSWSG